MRWDSLRQRLISKPAHRPGTDCQLKSNSQPWSRPSSSQHQTRQTLTNWTIHRWCPFRACSNCTWQRSKDDDDKPQQQQHPVAKERKGVINPKDMKPTTAVHGNTFLTLTLVLVESNSLVIVGDVLFRLFPAFVSILSLTLLPIVYHTAALVPVLATDYSSPDLQLQQLFHGGAPSVTTRQPNPVFALLGCVAYADLTPTVGTSK
ncbi:uncharacterized protein BO97DRAFT_17325 [Aspergillus homomorphus CBS 101889]|uniref:Uncharacterized protein n=1 Tax=Aspergillus homomorphus (strain CBS 101889) TaxID=1450537 RepID=A0A395I2T3_ASPHC|nr:hypothetical protein BO97DRAFT_17325 [Aspergillus homomorphus CBS 101889]RAL14016.1 hypothetical protein BO97DRAFT_17325 [Aspergillus homomorphus CBS 101889]